MTFTNDILFITTFCLQFVEKMEVDDDNESSPATTSPPEGSILDNGKPTSKNASSKTENSPIGVTFYVVNRDQLLSNIQSLIILIPQ